jgi:hypothetical protein
VSGVAVDCSEQLRRPPAHQRCRVGRRATAPSFSNTAHNGVCTTARAKAVEAAIRPVSDNGLRLTDEVQIGIRKGRFQFLPDASDSLMTCEFS